MKSELKSQVLISDRAHQLESVILTLGLVGHNNAGHFFSPKAPRRRIAQSTARIGQATNEKKKRAKAKQRRATAASPATARLASAFALANPEFQILLLDICVAVHVEKRGRRRQRRAYPKERKKLLHEAN